MPFVEVAVSAPQRFGQAYSYAVPEGMSLAPGDAVLAPFGPHTYPGIVLSSSDRPAFDGEVRLLVGRIGDAPLLLPHQLALARWLADTYLSPLASAIALVLPRGARAAADFLAPAAPALPALRMAAGAEATLRALAQLPAALAARALRAVAALLDAGEALAVRALRDAHGLTPRVEDALRDAGIVVDAVVAAGSTSPAACETPAPALPELTADQRRASEAIGAAMRRRFAGIGAQGAFLLHGVTGSGKTEVYLAALDLARAHHRQGIVLVPEIALTPQTERRFAARFPGRVAVMHGRLSAGPHRALWYGARAGAFDVVVGARSALFAPLPRLGLIVLDEEHEPSYKQSDSAPRYHAREAAAELARLTGAVLVLGSATPDLASYRRARSTTGALLTLPRRISPGEGGVTGTSPLPAIEVVNMARELRAGNPSVLSRGLDTALAATLAAGEQSLLFLNRRGAASLLLCRDCGYAPRCPRCSVAYALHAGVGKLICHHCHHSRGVPGRCPECKGLRFRPVGIGTERLEAIARERFPGARTLRWDFDTAKTPAKHAEFAAAVAAHEVDIVVGTQMVAKGHDFGGITLVGVVSADLSLNMPDFRAAERTFQLIVQVAGRAGRRDQPGRAFIQTYAPDHYAIRAAAAQDYAAFYQHEAEFRSQLAYPPFGALTRLVYSHRNEQLAEQHAEEFAAHLRKERPRLGLPGPEIVGPAPCFYSKLSNRWRWQILLRGAPARELLTAVTVPRDWAVDVGPVDVM